jgi:hypothetical protein
MRQFLSPLLMNDIHEGCSEWPDPALNFCHMGSVVQSASFMSLVSNSQISATLQLRVSSGTQTGRSPGSFLNFGCRGYFQCTRSLRLVDPLMQFTVL